jgi:hypothetical protein
LPVPTLTWPAGPVLIGGGARTWRLGLLRGTWPRRL